MVLVAMMFTNNFLNARLAENEFSTNKQFMLTTALQIDDIAWTMGRTQTIRYSSRFGQVAFQDAALTYSFEVLPVGSSEWQEIFTLETGIILFNMPTREYTLGSDYFERIFPSSYDQFLQEAASAPVSHVYIVEKLPMSAGNYTRVVVAPTVRMLNTTIGAQNYAKFFLPRLEGGANPMLSQSITLIGNNVTQHGYPDVSKVRFSVSFPNSVEGFDSDFFRFYSDTITLDSNSDPPFTPGSVVEFYVGEVTVSLGLHV